MGAIAKDSTLSGVIKNIIALGANGVRRHTSNEMITIIEQEPTTITGIANSNNSLSLDGVALCSLRISNQLKDSDGNAIGLKVRIYNDIANNSTSYMYDINGDEILFSLPASNKTYIITPDDIPALKYLARLSLRIIPDTTPATGAIKVRACLKA